MEYTVEQIQEALVACNPYSPGPTVITDEQLRVALAYYRQLMTLLEYVRPNYEIAFLAAANEFYRLAGYARAREWAGY